MNGFERWSVWATAIATTVTGIGYFWVKYMLQTDDPFAVVNHPLQPWLLKAHILVAPLLVFAVGLIAVRHVWRHYRAGLPRGRRSGVVTALVVGPMVVTGYLIQAVTHESWLHVIAIAHIAFGLLFAVGLALHQVFVRRAGIEEAVALEPGAPLDYQEEASETTAVSRGRLAGGFYGSGDRGAGA